MDSKANAICNALTKRLVELLNYGVTKIWMRASGTDRYLIPNILGISSDDWAHVVQHSGLFYPDKKIKSIAWQHLLGFTIDFRSFNVDGSSAMWFRFLS